MHASQLIELAALVARHAPVVLSLSHRLSAEGVHAVVEAGEERVERWKLAILDHERRAPRFDAARRATAWRELRPTLEEIFGVEIFVRVWASLLTAHDASRHRRDWATSVERLTQTQLDAGNLALRTLLSGPGVPLAERAELNRLRRNVETWTDLLLAQLVAEYGVKRFAYSPDRARDYWQETSGDSPQRRAWSWTLWLSSLRSLYNARTQREPANPDLNRRTARGVLSCLGPELFDAQGKFYSPWLARFLSEHGDEAPRRETPAVVNRVLPFTRPRD